MNSSAKRSLARIGLALLAASCLTGCVGYRLGSMLPADVRSVYIPTFVNKTDEPLIESATTEAAIREFQKDGTLKVAGAPEIADALLAVTIVKYELSPLSYDTLKRTTANEYRLILTASVVMSSQKTGKVIAESPKVQGENTFVLSGDMTSAKRQALPAAAADLAHDLVETVVEAWQ